MEGVSEWDAPLNPSAESSPRPDRCSDVDFDDSSPVSSNFASCDGSDFDRYCSANSVLGSASICSSIGNFSGTGEDFPLEGYNSRANGFYERSLARMSLSSRLIHDATESSSSRYGIKGGIGDSEKQEDECALNENLWNRDIVNHLDLEVDRVVKLEANEDAFCLSNLSESDGSMLDYGTDDEGRIQFGESGFKLVDKAKHEDVNPLFMSLSTAFGSNDWNEFVQDAEGGGLTSLSLHLDRSFQYQDEHVGREFEEKVEDMAVASFEVEDLNVKDVGDGHYVSTINHEAQVIDIHAQISSGKHSVLNSNEADSVEQTTKYLECASPPGLQNTPSEGNKVKFYLDSLCDAAERKIESSLGEEKALKGVCESSEEKMNGESKLLVGTFTGGGARIQSYLTLNGAGGEINRVELGTNSVGMPLSDTGDGFSTLRVQRKDLSYPHLAGGNVQDGEVKKLDINDSYDEMVLEMEEILLDSGNCHGPMYVQGNQGYISRQPYHFGDGSSVASTSATDDIFPPVQGSSKIDRVEVVGAKQKKGDVSFGERLVGVREYTIYQIHVWSGTDEWKVERRYRDFFALYSQLKALFTGHGLILPSAWSSVDQDSRKIFGNASPNVVLERSILIEDCLRSILNSRYPFGTPSPLILFLTPGKAMFKYGFLQSLVPQYLQKFTENENSDCGEPRPEHASLLGMTISLIVEIKPHKSLRQLLEIQHYTCAGCHRHLDAGKTLFRELVQTFGWNRPRFCEYTGQLFCASCHTNDTSVLPARVLHHWDFTLYPISQLAKAYLESIHDQPMLCVSAVNPFLFSKVPALLHVMGFRRKIGAMLPSVTCPFRSSIQKSLGFRRYLLESNDFFALRDLVDLSKGPFAALPVMVENMSNLILEHITQQCLVCYDSGVPCAARQACYEPSSLIFPFQEAEAEKCTACGSIFHKACYVDLLGCSCRNNAAITKRLGPAEPIMMGSHREPVGSLESSIRPLLSNSATGFFSSILTRVKPDKIWKTKNSSPVILMGSLPSSSL